MTPSIDPTQLMIMWPDGEPPLEADIVAALGGTVLAAPPDDPSIEWSVALELDDLPAPLVVWLEPAQPLPPGELQGVDLGPGRWVLGVQTALDADDPLIGYATLLRRIAQSFPRAPALLDVNTTRWFERTAIETLVGDPELEPPLEVLWTIQVAQRGSGPETMAWVHTHGLDRCGRCELEMIEIPEALVPTAAECLSEIAAHVLDLPPGSPPEVMEIGTDLAVALVPLANIVDTMDAKMPGGPLDRAGLAADAHVDGRVVVCATAEPPAQPVLPPIRVLQQIEEGTTTVYRSPRETEQRARRARATWDRVRDLHERGAIDRLIVEAGFDIAGSDEREHLWFSVECFDRDRVEACLLHEPRVAKIELGHVMWISRHALSDWRAELEQGVFSPGAIVALENVASGTA